MIVKTEPGLLIAHALLYKKAVNMNIKTIWPSKGGCNVFLIDAEKTALVDVGLTYCADELINKVKAELGGKELNYILLSHSHYDHVGALSEFRKAFPKAIVAASEITANVFKRPGAVNVMRELSNDAVTLYLGEDASLREMDVSGFYIDKIVKENDEIDLGNHVLKVTETPGHTNCSITFYEPEEGIFILSESTGSTVHGEFTIVPFLKSYKTSIESMHKILNMNPKRLIIPHYGEYLLGSCEQFLVNAENSAIMIKDIIKEGAAQGLDDDGIVKKLIKEEYDVYIKGHQPVSAFVANANPMVRVIHNEFPEYWY